MPQVILCIPTTSLLALVPIHHVLDNSRYLLDLDRAFTKDGRVKNSQEDFQPKTGR